MRILSGNSSEWTLAWGSTLPEANLAQMRRDQAHNHIPGWDKLNNKGVLAEMAERYCVNVLQNIYIKNKNIKYKNKGTLAEMAER